MNDDGILRLDLTPAPGGLARLQAALDERAARRFAPPVRAWGVTALAAVAAATAIALHVVENQPGSVLARRLDAALNAQRIAGGAQERGIVAELPSRNAHVRIVVSAPLSHVKTSAPPEG